MSKPIESASAQPERGLLMPLFVVDDVDRAHHFYSALLGFRESTPGPVLGHAGRMTILEHEQSPVCFATAEGAAVGQRHILCAAVPDVSAQRESLERRVALLTDGAHADEIRIGPVQDVSWGRYFEVESPLGPPVRFFELVTAAAGSR
ncbi:MAG: hypothetical protein R3F39_14465 [Myxococcota bacterium]